MDPTSTLNVIQHQPPQSSAGSSDSPAGIHCANSECRTRTGERSRGHQSCRWLLCGHCCQSAAKVAAESGDPRQICKVHSRRVHTGHRPLPKEPPAPNQNSSQNQNPVQFQNDQSGLNGQSASVWNSQNIDVDLANDLLERRSKLEQSLRRSIMLVVWYQNGSDPLRVPLEVTTFPLFRLSDFSDFVNELRLTPMSFIDAFNSVTGQWEQHKITTVRTIEQDQPQRLLYRLRPNLLEALTDCPAMDEEMSLQPRQAPLQMKRQAEEMLSSGGNTPVKQLKVIANAVPIRTPAPPPTTPSAQSNPLIISSNNVMSPNTRVAQPWIPMAGGTLPTPLAASPNPNNITSGATPGSSSTGPSTDWGFAPSGTIPLVNRNRNPPPVPPVNSNSASSNIEPPVQSPQTSTSPSAQQQAQQSSQSTQQSSSSSTRRWPTDFTVYEITTGFRTMTEICSMDPRERQRGAFERVFGCRYVKSTVGRARLYWKRASPEIKEHFLALDPNDQRGKWQNFVHLMDGRLIIEVGKGGEGGGVAGGIVGDAGGTMKDGMQVGMGVGVVGVGVVGVGENDERDEDEEETVNTSLGYSDPGLQAHLTLTGAPQANEATHGHGHSHSHSHNHSPTGHAVAPDPSLLTQSAPPPPQQPQHAHAHQHQQHQHQIATSDPSPTHAAQMGESTGSVHPGHPLSPQNAMAAAAAAAGNSFVTDRTMGRSSSSLSGAIPLPNS